MILRQYLDIEPVVAASYLVGCAGNQVAAVIDPLGEPNRYLDDAAALGVKLRYVIDTHVHADHVSAGRDLARRANAEYALFADTAPPPTGGGNPCVQPRPKRRRRLAIAPSAWAGEPALPPRFVKNTPTSCGQRLAPEPTEQRGP
jgi:glyoxylase-like metal-dependent hydrolase (beta-lactamase superfamily II)